jgi:hypothetical protein
MAWFEINSRKHLMKVDFRHTGGCSQGLHKHTSLSLSKLILIKNNSIFISARSKIATDLQQ